MSGLLYLRASATAKVPIEGGDMTEGQWFGVAFIVVGLYFVVCSTWARDFVLYRLKVERATTVMSEGVAHALYLLLGIGLIIAGGLQASKVWVV